jgi:phosphatidylglycerophosphatase A
MERNNFPNIKKIFQLISVGFAFFRVFDIFKPWPISYADQNLKNGFGVF